MSAWIGFFTGVAGALFVVAAWVAVRALLAADKVVRSADRHPRCTRSHVRVRRFYDHEREDA